MADIKSKSKVKLCFTNFKIWHCFTWIKMWSYNSGIHSYTYKQPIGTIWYIYIFYSDMVKHLINSENTNEKTLYLRKVPKENSI